MRSTKCRGLTLIEVLASLVLLATLLVAILQSHDRLARQTKLAQQRLDATKAADELLSLWAMDQPMAIPATYGQTSTEPSYFWSVETRLDRELEPFGIQVATLEIYATDQREGTPLTTVEFLTTAAVGDQSR